MLVARNIPQLCGLALSLALAGCTLPRSAGFQSEVLAAREVQTDAAGNSIYDFSVFAITRKILPVVTSWPDTGTRHYKWVAGQGQPASMLIAAGDEIQVTIWDAEENSLLTSPGQRVAQLQSMDVASDGRIFIPFVGNLQVAGMSQQTARARIEEMLLSTVPSAQVQIQVKPGRANAANLVSGVNSPGSYPLPDQNVSVLALIAQGGGIRSSITNPQVRLFRGNNIYGISIDQLFENPTLDTRLVGGDRVIVEEEERFFLSLGAANRQSRHLFPKDQVTALDALAEIGGVSDTRANPQGILILRQYPADALRADLSGPPQERMVFTIDLTKADGLFSAGKFEIQSGDLIYVTESPLGSARSVLSIVGSGLGLFNQIN
ncbi:MAG: polysaccharide export protein [Alphaproteobacteria bacterium]|jgi:polysaccharide export outer membrane protein|nr:polysaccharide export protein [Alphaproteobacteria bacterium]